MLTIDWKERLSMDTEYYLQHKLPNQDYDFEIIFNAYPERVNGKIPSEVIAFVATLLVQDLGKQHAEYLPFYSHLWKKKGDYGKIAFGAIMAKLLNKKPEIYLPLYEEALNGGTAHEINALLDKVMLPLLRKHPKEYLPIVFAWSKKHSEELGKQATNLLIKLMKRSEELLPQILNHFQNQWVYPLGETHSLHVLFLKTLAKVNQAAYLGIWQEFGISRDPQIVELLCSSLTEYYPEVEGSIELWTKSGNARVKKAALAAHKLILRKKGTK